jgi:hypothetical protein
MHDVEALRLIYRQAARNAFDGAETFDQFDEIADAVAVAVLKAVEAEAMEMIREADDKDQVAPLYRFAALLSSLRRPAQMISEKQTGVKP